MKKFFMKIRILGCGSSFGVPLIGNKFGKCDMNPVPITIKPINCSPLLM